MNSKTLKDKECNTRKFLCNEKNLKVFTICVKKDKKINKIYYTMSCSCQYWYFLQFTLLAVITVLFNNPERLLKSFFNDYVHFHRVDKTYSIILRCPKIHNLEGVSSGS